MAILPYGKDHLYEGVWHSGGEKIPVFLAVLNAYTGTSTADAIRDELGIRLAGAGHACFALHWRGECSDEPTAPTSAGEPSNETTCSNDYLRGAIEAFRLAYDVVDFALVGYGMGAWEAANAMGASWPAKLVWIEPPLRCLDEMVRRQKMADVSARWVFAMERTSKAELGIIEGIVPTASTVLVQDAEPNFQSGLQALGDVLVRCLGTETVGSRRG